MKRAKKIATIVMSLLLVFSISTTTFAAGSPLLLKRKAITPYNNKSDCPFEELKELEPYVYVNNNHYAIDYEKAIQDGIDENLVQSQQMVFDYLNSQADSAIIHINADLSFTDLSEKSLLHTAVHQEHDICAANGHWYNCGGGYNFETTYYWWGFSRSSCDCVTNKLIHDLNSCSAAATGAGVLGMFFGPAAPFIGGFSASYYWFLASRLAANNHGRGVHFAWSWLLIFDITPQ